MLWLAVGIILAVVEFLRTGEVDLGKYHDDGSYNGFLVELLEELYDALPTDEEIKQAFNASYSPKDSNTNIQVHDASIEWIDIACKDNKKLYDTKGNIIVIGNPSAKIHTMATYDINGNILADSSVKVRTEAKKVIFLDPGDKKDEKGKLKKLYEEGYISKSRYNVLMKDLNK